MRWSAIVVFFVLVSPAVAQESALHAELRREGERIGDSCNFTLKSIPMCGYTLFTDHPLHIAAGSMPPQNGFGVGGAFVWSKNTRNWRMSSDFDAVGAASGGWRAGGYIKLIHTPHPPRPSIVVEIPKPGEAPKSQETTKQHAPFTHPYTVFNFYVQNISLNKLYFFGEGNDSTLAGASVFGMRQTIVGANAIKPVYEFAPIRRLNLALLGEVNGRFVNLRSEHGQSVPSIETLYTNTTAPGLASQPAYLQLGQGVRIKPVIGRLLELNYSANLEEFLTSSPLSSSFERWTVDLNHTFYLYGYSALWPTVKNTDATGPDSCGRSGESCPNLPHTWNLNGTIGARLLISESMNSPFGVPFYFQPTLGGQDIDSHLSLGSYRDYRFRAPNLLLLQESFEHSIWGPFGLKLIADQGRVAVARGDLGFSHLKHSFAAGLTLRAGAFPMVSLMFAWGGPEGHHNILNMNTTLLGASSRPALD
jgi:hypothetical protein